MKRLLSDNPTVAMLLTFVIMSCAFAYCPMWLKIVFASASFIFSLCFFVRPARCFLFGADVRLSRAVLLVACAVFVSSAVSLASFNIYAGGIAKSAGTTETAYFRITDVEREYPYITYYKAEIISSDSLPKGTDFMFSTPVGGLKSGDVLFSDVTYSSLDERSTSTFDGENYYLSRGIMIIAEAEFVDKIAENDGFSLTHFFSSIRAKLAAKIAAHCGKDEGSLASAVLLGYKDGLSPSLKRDFRRLGISHLLAISGTHFSAIIALLEFAMRRFRLRPRARACVNIVFALFFIGLTGFAPSVVRAGIMHVLAQLSIIVARKPNMLNSYALSGAAILIFSPFSAVDIGFQLSFAATLGCIVYMTERISVRRQMTAGKQHKQHGRLQKLMSKLGETVLLTLTVTLFTLPLSWLYFGEISLASIPVNIVAVPLVTALIYLTGAFLILYPLRLFIIPIAKLIDLLGGLIIGGSEVLSRIGGVSLRIDYGFAPFIIIPIAVLLLAFPFSKRKARSAVCALALFALLVSVSLIVGATDKATYFSSVAVGKNDGFVVKSEGKVLVADMSDASNGYSYELTNEADSYRVTEIDTVLLTHYHNKHVSQFGGLCEREVVRNLVIPAPSGEKERAVSGALCDTAARYGVTVHVLAEDETYLFGGAEIEIFDRTYLSRSSHPVCGVMISADGDDIVLLSGSWNEGGEEYSAAVTDAEYLILGAHSPTYKKEYDIANDGSVKRLVISDDAYNHMSEESRKKFGDIISEDELRLKWK